MKFLNGITLLLIFQLLGEITTIALKLPVPGPVLGMTFLFLTLVLRGNVSPSLDLASDSLLAHFSLLFIPAGVGVMAHFDRLSAEWLPITIALILSTLITVTGTAAIMALANRLLPKRFSSNA